MSRPVLDIKAGRDAFGEDPDGYERARPAYPEAIFDRLRDRCGLRLGTVAFEVGPGPGNVTERLAGGGAAKVTAIEPDARSAEHLCRRFAGKLDLTVLNTIFEDAALPASAFDLGVAATSFHWVEQKPGIAKVADALKPGGWWACWWNLFSEGTQTDPFIRASAPLFRDVPRPHSGSHDRKFELDVDARLADLNAEPRLANAEAEVFRWTVPLTADQVRDLYGSFSIVVALEPQAKRRLLDGLHELAVKQFGGRIEKPMIAVLYTARRR